MPDPCQRTATEISALIKSLKGQIQHTGPRTTEEIQALEAAFDTHLPADYRQFMANYGTLSSPRLCILGLSDSEQTNLSVGDAIFLLRLNQMSFPLNFVPIEDLGEGRFACLACSSEKSAYGPVYEVNLNHIPPIAELPQLAPCFRDYLYRRLQDLKAPTKRASDPALAVLEKHVRDYQAKFGYDHAAGGKLPRNHDWRPYRYCIQDVLFGSTVVRHSREANYLEVDVFLTADIPEYGPLAGARALGAFLLSEAYKCGGTMEIRFTKNVEGGQVPQELTALATQLGVPAAQTAKDRLSPIEAKALYAALTDFSPALQEKINALEQARKIHMARACFVVHHGVWSREQIEMIVLGSARPDSLLGGFAQPHQRHLYVHDLLHARAALLGGLLDLRLAKRERYSEAGVAYDLEDDVRPLTIGFDADTYAKVYVSEEALPMPWVRGESHAAEIPARTSFHVLIRARDPADLLLHLSRDLQFAQQVRAKTDQPTFIAVPFDFVTLPEAFIQAFDTQMQQAQVRLLVCPETVQSLDADAAQRLARSRVLRQ